MNNITQLPVIAGVEITTDNSGRFNLNALHRASGLGSNKAPAQWLRTDSALALAKALDENNVHNCILSIKGRNGGTFAVEHLAVAYANWISPKFYLTVIQTFLDYKKGTLQPAIPQTLPEALRLAAELAEVNEAMKPKVEALDRIATSDGNMCITNAAKDLQMRPKDLFHWLHANRWIYRRPGAPGWIAYQYRLQRGVLEHKVATVGRTDGSEKIVEQVRITPKGMAQLAERLNSTQDAA